MSESPPKAIFLSYASQDAEAAKKICDALRAAGVEVWFDAEGGLEHGDEWDAKIRRQIKECVLFLPVISANTQAREEGYFRIEWELAAQRALGIASGVAFILPVVIDGTKEPAALVPDRFRSVQWTKLPGGNVPPEVLQRFLKLWSHRTGALKHAAAGSIPAGEFTAAPATARRHAVWPWVAGGVAALAAAYLVFKPRGNPEVSAKAGVATSTPTSVPGSANGLSEARQLVDKAYTLIRGLEVTREDFVLADEYCQRALKLDPDDGEVWAAASQVDAAFGYRGWDTSAARREQTRVTAERAIRLAPKSVNARLAQAGAWSLFGINRDEREKLLREVLVDQPDNQGALRFLAVTVLAKPDGLAECLALNEGSAALPGGDPLALFNNARYLWTRGQPAQGYAVLQRALAQQPFASALVLKMAMEVNWRGDLAAAEATLRLIPQSALQEDRANYEAGLLRYSQGNADAALEIWQAFPRDYYVDFVYDGPKGLLLGLADELDHRDAAAKIEWHAALQLVEKKIAATPNNPAPYYSQAYLLACLGEKAAAGEALRTHEQLAGIKYTPEQPMSLSLAKVYVRLGRLDEVFAHPPVSELAILRVSPNFAALRADPRFARLSAAAPAPAAPAESAAPGWPQDPELKRAMRLIDSPEAIASDVTLAEDIVKGRLADHPTDADATLAMGRVQVYSLLRGFDRSEERFAAAKHFAERALALSPDNPEALMVMATYLSRRGVELPHALKLLRQAIVLRPDNPLYYRMVDNVLSAMPNVSDAEVIASAKLTAGRFPADALVQYELARHYRDAGMLAEAEHYLDLAIKLGPVANAVIARARLMLFVHGDPAGMQAMLEQLPERFLGTDRAVFSQFSYALAMGQPQRGLDALQALPEPWMIDFDYTGPIALLQGELLLLQGKTEIAQLRFTEALAELGRHQATLERNFSTTWLEPWLLMRLGRLDEARHRSAVFFPELARPFRLNLSTNWWFNPVAQNLLLGEHAKAVELMREAVGFPEGRVILRHALRLDPRMAPYRADPEIAALVAEPPETPAAAAPPVDDKSVAVLAFANLSDDKANEYFSDGISEELLNVLAKIPGLKVSARTSAFYFKGKEVTVPEIARQLGVAYVVEGSVRKQGDKVRITAQLIKATDGFHVWSDTFTRDLKDIFAVQDEIAGLIAKNLSLKMGMTAARPTIDVEAYQEYLAGRALFAKASNGDLREAVGHFEKAVAIEPKFTAAWVQLASAHTQLGRWGGAPTLPSWAAARAAIDQAVALEPDSPDVLLALGWILRTGEWDWRGAEQAFRRALQLRPNHPETLAGAAVLLFNIGKGEEGFRLGQRAAQLDPLNPATQLDLSIMFYLSNNPVEAERPARRALALAPGGAGYHSVLGWALMGQRRYDEAAAEAALDTDVVQQTSVLGPIALVRGQTEAARAQLARLEKVARTNGDSADLQNTIAWIAAGLGEKDRAFAALEKARASRDPSMAWLRSSTYLASLYSDPRWNVLLHQVGLADDQLK